VSTTVTGSLVEINDTSLMLDGHTHIMLPPGLKVDDLVVGEHLMVTVSEKSSRWTAERTARSPV
jgi:hypothetical protein